MTKLKTNMNFIKGIRMKTKRTTTYLFGLERKRKEKKRLSTTNYTSCIILGGRENDCASKYIVEGQVCPPSNVSRAA
jgi:hypothetical protein